MKRLFVSCALSASLAACATPRSYNKIDSGARPHITKAESVLVVTQSEIGTEINASNVSSYTGGGLIPALIDVSVNSQRTKKAETLVAGLRDKLIDYDYAARLETYLEDELVQLNIVGVNEVELTRSTGRDFLKNRIGKTDADVVVYILADYKLTPDFGSVVSNATVAVYPKAAALNAYKEKPDTDDKLEPSDNIYRNSFRSVVPLEVVGTINENAESIEDITLDEWITFLDLTAQRLAKKIAADLAENDDKANAKTK